ETRHKSRCSHRDQEQDRVVNNNPDRMKARIVRQGKPLHHKMHGATEHEYQKAEQEQAPSGTQLFCRYERSCSSEWCSCSSIREPRDSGFRRTPSPVSTERSVLKNREKPIVAAGAPQQ